MARLKLWFGESTATHFDVCIRFGEHVKLTLEEHLRIVDLCGNFPHRNHYHNRTTSTVGRALMNSPDVRFDLPLIAAGGHVRFGHDSTTLWAAIEATFDVIERLDTFAKHKVQRKTTIVTDWLTPAKAADFWEK
jgi:hypothetical protein